MPHPKNHMKLTGDTHPPEVEYDLDPEDDAADVPRLDDVALRMGRTQPVPEPFWTSEPAAVSSARAFARSQPLAALGLGLVVGYALLKLLRR